MRPADRRVVDVAPAQALPDLAERAHAFEVGAGRKREPRDQRERRGDEGEPRDPRCRERHQEQRRGERGESAARVGEDDRGEDQREPGAARAARAERARVERAVGGERHERDEDQREVVGRERPALRIPGALEQRAQLAAREAAVGRAEVARERLVDGEHERNMPAPISAHDTGRAARAGAGRAS
jgi:hypothetical protein